LSYRYQRRLPRGGVDRNHQITILLGTPRVASRAEAWIETLSPQGLLWLAGVASRAEAWIETICWPAACWRATRRLPRGGVDRNRDRADHGRWRNVASRAEAWIETCSEPSPMSANRRRLPRGGVDRNLTPAPGTAMIVSPPARRRGSKHHVIDVVILHHASPPARRRGSKHELLADSLVRLVSPPARRRGSKLVRSAIVRQNAQVASRAEAWIETCASMATGRRPMVASRAEAWIETEQTGL